MIVELASTHSLKAFGGRVENQLGNAASQTRHRAGEVCTLQCVRLQPVACSVVLQLNWRERKFPSRPVLVGALLWQWGSSRVGRQPNEWEVQHPALATPLPAVGLELCLPFSALQRLACRDAGRLAKDLHQEGCQHLTKSNSQRDSLHHLVVVDQSIPNGL